MSYLLIFLGGSLNADMLAEQLDILEDYAGERQFIIAADSGLDYAISMGYRVDLLVGDFDSTRIDPFNSDNCLLTKKIKLSTEKDLTDSQAALIEAEKIAGAYDYIVVAGFMGSRLDHSLANMRIFDDFACRIKNKLILVDENNFSFYLSADSGCKNFSWSFSGVSEYYFSVLPLGESMVSIEGAKYNLDKRVMEGSGTLGISNEILSLDDFKLSLHSGDAMIIFSRD